MLLNILPCTGQPAQQRTSVYSAEVEKPYLGTTTNTTVIKTGVRNSVHLSKYICRDPTVCQSQARYWGCRDEKHSYFKKVTYSLVGVMKKKTKQYSNGDVPGFWEHRGRHN